MSRQDKHKIAATLRAATYKSKILSHKSLMLLPAAAALGVLALVSVLFTSADTASNTYAANLGSQITTEVDGQYYVTLTAPDVNFSVSPSKNENAAKQRIDVGVETNVAGGAKLYLSMAGSSNSLHLNGNTAQSSPVIAAVPNDTDASSFPANTWGYSTDDQTYSAVPTTASDPALLANVDGETTGTTSGSVISASIPVYYAANVDTSIPSGSYSNRMTYSAVVDGGITAEATLTSIKVDGQDVKSLQLENINTITVTTNLMTSSFGVPRVYYETTNPTAYVECGNVVASKNSEGYMTISCSVTPDIAATGVTLRIAPKGDADDKFCADGTYVPGTSDCEVGTWQWGSFVVDLPDIKRPTFGYITTMQEMTPEICANAAENETARLVDERDGKLYWVAKLADGNCWMTQNLDLDLQSGKVLTPDDSDVSSNWNPGATTFTVASRGDDYEYNYTVQSWDLGDVVLSSPFNNGSSYSSCDTTTNLYTSACSQHWTDVSGDDWVAMDTINLSGNSVDEGNHLYDAHYLIGNYYAYEASTAGTGHETEYKEGAVATDSICPKGWRLPQLNDISGTSFNNVDGSYNKLLASYGLTVLPWEYENLGEAKYFTNPLYFVRGGYLWGNGKLSSAGRYGTYATATGEGSIKAYSFMVLRNDTIDWQTANGVNVGRSVRCVATSS